MRGLLEALRADLGPEVAYADEPVRLLGGNQTSVHAFRLANAPPPWDVPLILRAPLAHRETDDVRFDSAVQNALADQGLPVPRILWCSTGRDGPTGACQVMERVAGRALLLGDVGGEVRGVRFLARVVGSLRESALGPWPELLASVHADVHAASLPPVLSALEAVGLRERVSLRAKLERLARDVDALDQPDLEPAATWLWEREADLGPPTTLCHGDLFPNQVFVEGGRVTGIIDWSDAFLAWPEVDVGLVAAGIATVPLGVPGAGALQKRLVRRFRAAYRRARPLDAERLRFGEVLRCTIVLCALARHRAGAGPAPVPYDGPRGAAMVARHLAGLGIKVAVR